MIERQKFGRNYRLTLETDSGGELVIEPPITIEFDLTRNTLEAANICQVRIYNLSKLRRNQIYFNQGDYVFNQGAVNQSLGEFRYFRRLVLKAGYGLELSTIFIGNYTQAWSVREGVNYITQIEVMDGAASFISEDISIEFPKDTAMKKVIETIMGKLSKEISVGEIGNFEGKLKRDNTYTGNPTAILFELTGGGFFIDRNVAYAIRTDEYIPDTTFEASPTIVVEANSGLLNTPTLEGTNARFEMLFEPTLNPGRRVKVQSSTFELLNGEYKINAVKHRGIISPSISGSLITVADFRRTKPLIPAKKG